jgi:hypothetical protein
MRPSEFIGLEERQILWVLNHIEEVGRALDTATDRRMRRQALIRTIAECAEDGKVAVIESGMDCDGSEYRGFRRLIDANVKAFDALHSRIAKSADGWFTLTVERPSTDVEYSSRDLALEAFEDGHPYSLHI